MAADLHNDPEWEYLLPQGVELTLPNLLAEWIDPISGHDISPTRRALVAEARDEITRLERWKAETLQVLSDWELVFDALGKPGELGESKPAAALAEVKRSMAMYMRNSDALITERDRLRSERDALLWAMTVSGLEIGR